MRNFLPCNGKFYLRRTKKKRWNLHSGVFVIISLRPSSNNKYKFSQHHQRMKGIIIICCIIWFFVRQVLVLSRNHAKRCVICDMLPCCKQSNNHVIRCMHNRTKVLFQMHHRSATYYLHRNLFSKTFANIKKLIFANF